MRVYEVTIRETTVYTYTVKADRESVAQDAAHAYHVEHPHDRGDYEDGGLDEVRLVSGFAAEVDSAEWGESEDPDAMWPEETREARA